MIADPELTTTQLGPQDAFVVLATDGVWEFISSQDAVDLVRLLLLSKMLSRMLGPAAEQQGGREGGGCRGRAASVACC